MNEIAAIVLVLMLGAFALALYPRKTKARTAVNAECLACTYQERFKDVRTARAAGNMHGDKTGHPLILVLAGKGPAA